MIANRYRERLISMATTAVTKTAPRTATVVAFPAAGAPASVSEEMVRAARRRVQAAEEAREYLAEQVTAARAACEQAAAGKPGKGAARYEYALAAYDRQCDRVAAAEAQLRRLEVLRDQAEYWTRRRAELDTAFRAQYGNRGPQYEVLIKRVVYAEVRAEMLEATGQAVDTIEWRRASQSVLDAIAALQKYTEGQKTEVIQKKQQEAILVVLGIAERIVAPRQPGLWARVVDEIERQLAIKG
jgi:hypothetical protein